ncbi:uncharacterized protein DDB_G0283357 [Condylostylus longicornis]|uniref:uncharacterized protein DDB_G0283357 n=1 Tax=Condylostylus longicornis TaxID=2530218 RepID=UPI00244DB8D3|nr:uncharacterized protein DDB_G0283357 [Condylostylus longicornis]
MSLHSDTVHGEVGENFWFDGRCGHTSPCEQLCYEIHDGMYECDCYEGYELNKNGYSCQELNNTYLQDGSLRSEEDILYQKGVSFSAKLESNSNINNNFNSNYIDLNSENSNGIEDTDNSYENIKNNINLSQQLSHQSQDYKSNNQFNDDNISYSSDDSKIIKQNSVKVPGTSLTNKQQQQSSIKTKQNPLSQQHSIIKNSPQKKSITKSISKTPGSITSGNIKISSSSTGLKTKSKTKLFSITTTATTSATTTTTTSAPSIPSISIIDLNNLQYSDSNDYYSKQDMSIYDDVNNNKLNLRQFNSDTYQNELLQKQNTVMQQQEQQQQNSQTSTLKYNSESKIMSNDDYHNNINNKDNNIDDDNINNDDNGDDDDDNDGDDNDDDTFSDKDSEVSKILYKNNDNNYNSIAKGSNTYTSTIASYVPPVTFNDDDSIVSNNEMNSNKNSIQRNSNISVINDESVIKEKFSKNIDIVSSSRNSISNSVSSISNSISNSESLSLTPDETNAADINLQQRNSVPVSSSISTLKDINSTESLRVSWRSCNLDCGSEGLCDFMENDAEDNQKQMRCLCPFGKTGNGCTQDLNVTVPRFTHKSWLAFPALRGAYKHVQLRVEFHPESFDGIILLTGERDDLTGDFMALLIHQGYIEFWFDCGSGVGSVRSKEIVELNQWNTVIIYRHRWDAWLMLNHGQRVQGRSKGLFSRITFREPVFLGGTGNITGLSKRLPVQNGMIGCIRRFIANEHEYKFTEYPVGDVTKGFDIQDCTTDKCVKYPCQHGGECLPTDDGAVCLCPIGFSGDLCEMRLDLQVPSFNGTSYLRYAPLGDSALIWLELQIIIKPHHTDGVILYSGHDEHGDYIALSLNNGYVEFTFDLGSGPAIVRSDYPLVMEEWHTIRISRTARLAVLKVNQFSEVMTVSSNGFWHLSLPHSLYLGGIHSLHHVPSGLKERGSFIGCIQKVEINGRSLSIISEAIAGSDVENCPHACIANPCGPLAECLPLLESYECRCNPFNAQCNKAEEVALKENINESHFRNTQLLISNPNIEKIKIKKNQYEKDLEYNYDDDEDDDDDYDESEIQQQPYMNFVKITNNVTKQPTKQITSISRSRESASGLKNANSTITVIDSMINSNVKIDGNGIVIITEKSSLHKDNTNHSDLRNKIQSPQISDIYYYYYDKDDDQSGTNYKNNDDDDNGDENTDGTNIIDNKNNFKINEMEKTTVTTTEKLTSFEPETIIKPDYEHSTTSIINHNYNKIKSYRILKPINKIHKHHNHHNNQHHHSYNHNQNKYYNNNYRNYQENNHHQTNDNQHHPKVNLYKKMLFNIEVDKNNSDSKLKGYKKDNNLLYKIDQYITLEKDDQIDQDYENFYNSNNNHNNNDNNNSNDNKNQNNKIIKKKNNMESGLKPSSQLQSPSSLLLSSSSSSSSEDNENSDFQLSSETNKNIIKESNQMGEFILLSEEKTSKESNKNNKNNNNNESNNNNDNNNDNNNNYRKRKHKKFSKKRYKISNNNNNNNEKLKMAINSNLNKNEQETVKDKITYENDFINHFIDSNNNNNNNNKNKEGDIDSNISYWQQDDNNSENIPSFTNKNVDNSNTNNNDYSEPITTVKIFNNKRKKFTNHKKGKNNVNFHHNIHHKNRAPQINQANIFEFDIPSDIQISSTTTVQNSNENELIKNSNNNNNNNSNIKNIYDNKSTIKTFNTFNVQTSSIPDTSNININNNVRDKSTSSAFLVDEKDFQTKELIKDMERIMKNADGYDYDPLKDSLTSEQNQQNQQQHKEQQLQHQQQSIEPSNSYNVNTKTQLTKNIGNHITDLNSNIDINNEHKPATSNINNGNGIRSNHRKIQQHGACFTGTDSYFHYNDAETMSQIISYNVDLNLRFKTHSNNGIILWTGRQSAREKDDYLSLGIENGYLHLRYNLGSGETNIQFNTSKVSDGLWHRVRAMRNSQEGFLEVDGRKSIPQRSPGKLRQLNTDTGLYVGGMPDVSFYTRRRYYTGIVGCISEIVLAGELKLNLDPATLGTARNVETGIL